MANFQQTQNNKVCYIINSYICQAHIGHSLSVNYPCTYNHMHSHTHKHAHAPIHMLTVVHKHTHMCTYKHTLISIFNLCAHKYRCTCTCSVEYSSLSDAVLCTCTITGIAIYNAMELHPTIIFQEERWTFTPNTRTTVPPKN